MQALLGNWTMLKRLKTLGALAWPVWLDCSGACLLETRTDRESRQTAGQTSPGLLMVSELVTLLLTVFITCRKCSYCCSNLSPVYCEVINHPVVFSADLSNCDPPRLTEMFLNILNILDYLQIKSASLSIYYGRPTQLRSVRFLLSKSSEANTIIHQH